MSSQSSKKIPLYIIIIVIIFILVFVVILASLGSNEKTIVKAPYYKKELKNKKSMYDNSIVVSSYGHSKVSDSFVIEIPGNINNHESYIFGGPMQYSTVSVYKKTSDSEESLLSSHVFNGNQGFVICSNLNIVNSSYYQIGKKINLENTRYNFIPITQDLVQSDDTSTFKIIVNNIGYEDFKVYKCMFNYDLSHNPINKNKQALSNFGLSEYDIEKLCQEKLKLLDQNIDGKKVNLLRTFNKKKENRVWRYDAIGNYVVFYVKGIYSFEIKDSYNNIHILEQGTKDLQNGSLEFFRVTDPRLLITNLDENIPHKSFNDDVVSLMNAPVSFYKHFVYGKKKERVDIWNRIQNKIFVYKI